MLNMASLSSGVEHGEVTSLLLQLQKGDADAERRLMEVVYPELKRMANAIFRRESQGHTLQPTALVHEAYIKLANSKEAEWKNRAHFFAIASLVMRQLLVDYARKRQSAKRGYGENPARLDLDKFHIDNHSLDAVLVVDEALQRLHKVDQRQAQVVQLRFFGGLSEKEVALVTGMNARTVRRDWQMAKAWLKGLLTSDVAAPRA